jgi:hypothetical protein
MKTAKRGYFFIFSANCGSVAGQATPTGFCLLSIGFPINRMPLTGLGTGTLGEGGLDQIKVNQSKK